MTFAVCVSSGFLQFYFGIFCFLKLQKNILRYSVQSLRRRPSVVKNNNKANFYFISPPFKKIKLNKKDRNSRCPAHLSSTSTPEMDHMENSAFTTAVTQAQAEMDCAPSVSGLVVFSISGED